MKLHQLSPWITTFPFLPWLLPWWSTLLSSASEDCMLLRVVTNISCLSCSAEHPQHHANGWGKAQLLPPEQALASCGDDCCSGPGAYCSQGHAGAGRFLFCFPSWKFGWFCYVAPACSGREWAVPSVLSVLWGQLWQQGSQLATCTVLFCVSPLPFITEVWARRNDQKSPFFSLT